MIYKTENQIQSPTNSTSKLIKLIKNWIKKLREMFMLNILLLDQWAAYLNF